ncbi:PilZ domain-containing protein [Rhabdothermincola salaria]|uniref:PilZ domain-containing protein n=1 Tax=Rhabdothermincola salaria TaxID=2903142 RepID=UPI001E2F0311|nr:PilZ domain-containing protein [Rhabdothermincola salaria]MCD9624532.1 hypothetical protein [Rhabdothermincola salaria]
MERPGPYERRIGERVPIEPIEVTWLVPAEESGRFGRRRRVVREQSGRVLDVSITGAAIEGPAESGLRTGAEVTIRACGGDSVVRIRRAQETERSGILRYGVEFVALDGGLKGEVSSILQRGRPGESTWRRSL